MRPFRLQPLSPKLPAPLATLLRDSLESLLKIDALNDAYRYVTTHNPPREFCPALLSHLSVEVRLSDEDRARIPRSGALIVVANHPFGIVEGVVMSAVLEAIRHDFKLLANQFLACVPEAHDRCIFVDSFNSPAASATNLRALRASIGWLKQGNTLGIFPAGEVAHWQSSLGQVVDSPWTENLAWLVRKSGATVLPMYFAGTNGPLFQMAGMIHPRLRTALLPRELLNKRKRVCTVHIGPPIRADQLATLGDDRRAVEYLRFRTEALAGRLPQPQARMLRFMPKGSKRLPGLRIAPLAAARSPLRQQREIDRLPAEALLASAGDLHVYLAPAEALDELMLELGRQRERAFRLVGEGTGRALDLDRFDRIYQHLLVWDHAQHELIGGYRLAPVDEILRLHGRKGLYASTLFDIEKRYFEELGPAVELGRSFVRPEAQRSFAPLMLLWKGIGQFVARQPRYTQLLGPVSISNQFRPLSRALLVSLLSRAPYRAAGADLVHPRKPFPLEKVAGKAMLRMAESIVDVDELAHIVADIEPAGHTLPVLLRQYLKLGAKMLGFNVDPKFGHCVDGLCVLNLLDVERRTLRRYLGPEQSSLFLAAHGVRVAAEVDVP
jgi:putative hemolysin